MNADVGASKILNETPRDWHTRVVTLSSVKSLLARFFAEFILSFRNENIRQQHPPIKVFIIKEQRCAKLENHYQFSIVHIREVNPSRLDVSWFATLKPFPS